MPECTTSINLRSQKIDGKPFFFDRHNQMLFDAFQAQAPAGNYINTLKKVKPPKTNPQLGYYWGGIIGDNKPDSNGMVKQLIDRGDDILGHITVWGKEIPIMTNKENCDKCLKAFYMVSIGKPGEKFSISEKNVEEFSVFIDWAVHYLARYRNIYIMSSEEYKELRTTDDRRATEGINYPPRGAE